MKYVGRQMVDFTNNNGDKVQGIKMHLVGLDDRVEGECCFTQFINFTNPLYQKVVSMPFGEVNIVYGPRGTVQNIVVAGK